MRAIILAAGQGTRLRPYTLDKPKCMVSLAGKPLLHRQLDVLTKAGIGDVTIVGGYLSEKLQTANVSIITNEKYATTNMVTTLFCAREKMLADEDLLICYGDIVYQPSVLETIMRSDAEISITADSKWRNLWELRMSSPLDDAETFIMDNNHKVLQLGKKANTYDEVQAQYMGLIKIRADKIEDFINSYDEIDKMDLYDGQSFENMYMTSFLQHLIDTDWNVQACLVENGWLEVDTAEELELYEAMINQGQFKNIITLA